MSGVNEHSGGRGYAPLPQSISNTDTEDEDEHLQRTLNDSNRKQPEDTTNVALENGRFYPLDETRNLATRVRNGRAAPGHCADDVPIMVIDGDSHDDLWKRRDISPLRRFCLVNSILLCIATILVFLYVLPCNDSGTCPRVPEVGPSLSWDLTLQGVELHGPVSVVPASPFDLVFLLRGQRYGGNGPGSPGQQKIPSGGGGVLSLQGSTGLTLWWVPLKRLPTDIDCGSLDVDGSGKSDCLVAGDQGLLVSIEPTAGTIHWSSTVHTYSKLPVLLPDIDSDGIYDLLSVEIMDGPILGLVLLSGRSGQLLGRHLITNCPSISIYKLDSNATVFYLCEDSTGTQSVRSIPLKELLDNVNSSQVRKKLTIKPNSTPNAFVASNHNFAEYSWELTPIHRLTVKNGGRCPGELCQSSVNLTLQKGPNESRSIWNHTGANSYAMEPVILMTTGRPDMTGFAIKFWQWTALETEPEDKVDSGVMKRKITERVMIVLMNRTEVHAVNASQSEISQLCQGTDCQPSLHLQTRSLAIADLNGDGSRELISYQSTYDYDKDQSLTSKVQVVKLETEVAKLTQPDTV